MGPLHQRVPAAHRYLPHVLRHLIPGACPRALGPGGCCAFRENASAATSALTVTARPRRGLPLRSTLAPAWGGKSLPPGARPEGRCAFRENPPAAPVDATATRPDRRDAAPGGAPAGSLRVSRKYAPPPMPPRPSRQPGCSPWQTLAGHALRHLTRGSARVSRKPRPPRPPMPPRPIPTAGMQPWQTLAGLLRISRKPVGRPRPMPPRPIRTVGTQPLADPGSGLLRISPRKPARRQPERVRWSGRLRAWLAELPQIAPTRRSLQRRDQFHGANDQIWMSLTPWLPSMPPRPVPTVRDAAPGWRTLAGLLRISRKYAHRLRRCHRDPSGPPGRSPWRTLAGLLRISRKPVGRPGRCHRDPSGPPGRSPWLADPAGLLRVSRKYAHRLRRCHRDPSGPPGRSPPMPPRPVRTAGTQPLADPRRVVAHFAKTHPPPRRCHRDPSRPSGCSPWRTLARRDAAPGGPWQGRCAFRENPSAAPADAIATHPDRRVAATGGPSQGRCAFRENPPAAPADAAATHPDRRDASSGKPSQGRCAFSRNTPAATNPPPPIMASPKPATRRRWTAPQPTRNSAGAGTPREAPCCASAP